MTLMRQHSSTPFNRKRWPEIKGLLNLWHLWWVKPLGMNCQDGSSGWGYQGVSWYFLNASPMMNVNGDSLECNRTRHDKSCVLFKTKMRTQPLVDFFLVICGNLPSWNMVMFPNRSNPNIHPLGKLRMVIPSTPPMWWNDFVKWSLGLVGLVEQFLLALDLLISSKNGNRIHFRGHDLVSAPVDTYAK